MKKLINHNKAMKYLFTGGLSFLVDYLLLLACYYALSQPLWFATTIGYLGGLCISFSINRAWVFGEHGKKRKITRQLVEYVLLLLFNYAFTVYAIRILDSMGVSPSISKIVLTFVIAIWNYIIFNKFIFGRDKYRLTQE